MLPVAALALAMTAGCAGPPEAVPYSSPVPGTVYDFGDFTNTVTAVDGWRTTYVDDRGRTGRRVALFITEDPRRPLTFVGPPIDSLWPLRLGTATTLRTREGDEVYRWEFRVLDTTTVTVPAGTFAATVVEGTRVPELVHAPQGASTVLNTWWYAPAVGTVVRFESNYLTGPGQGRRFTGELRSIRPPPAADSAAAAGEAAGGAAGG